MASRAVPTSDQARLDRGTMCGLALSDKGGRLHLLSEISHVTDSRVGAPCSLTRSPAQSCHSVAAVFYKMALELAVPRHLPTFPPTSSPTFSPVHTP